MNIKAIRLEFFKRKGIKNPDAIDTLPLPKTIKKNIKHYIETDFNQKCQNSGINLCMAMLVPLGICIIVIGVFLHISKVATFPTIIIIIGIVLVLVFTLYLMIKSSQYNNLLYRTISDVHDISEGTLELIPHATKMRNRAWKVKLKDIKFFILKINREASSILIPNLNLNEQKEEMIIKSTNPIHENNEEKEIVEPVQKSSNQTEAKKKDVPFIPPKVEKDKKIGQLLLIDDSKGIELSKSENQTFLLAEKLQTNDRMKRG